MIYTIYLRDNDNPQNAVFIKEGFSPLAMVFSSFWFFYHRAWFIGFIFFIFSMTVRMAMYDSGLLSIVIILLMSLFSGVFGNDLLQRQLTIRGYNFISAVVANNLLEAKVKFF